MGLFSQSSIKRSVGTRPNTPVFDNAEDEGNVDDQYEDEDDNNEDYDNEDDDGNEYDNNEDDNDYGYEEDEGKITRTISPFQSGPSLFSAPKAQTDQGNDKHLLLHLTHIILFIIRSWIVWKDFRRKFRKYI